jgi:hypothetical protein
VLIGITPEVCRTIAHAEDGTSTFGPMRHTLRRLTVVPPNRQRPHASTTAWLQTMLPYTSIS